MEETILVIDDDDDFRATVSRLLVTHGYRIVQAAGGATGIAAAAADPPDLVLLDLILEDMDGQDVASEIRTLPALSRVPIVVISGAAEEDLRPLLGSFDGFVRKPFRIAHLLQTVRERIAHRAHGD